MPMPMLPRPLRRTHPLIWCASIVIGLILLLVVIAGIVVFIAYLAIDPKVPQFNIHRANLDSLVFDQAGVLTVQITVVAKADNRDNAKAYASFYDTKLALSFQGQTLAYLVAPTLDVKANQSVELKYPLLSYSIHLTSKPSDALDSSLERGKINFQLKGTTWTRWRVWRLGSVKFMLDVDCQLHLRIDMSTTYPRHCSSRLA